MNKNAVDEALALYRIVSGNKSANADDVRKLFSESKLREPLVQFSDTQGKFPQHNHILDDDDLAKMVNIDIEALWN